MKKPLLIGILVVLLAGAAGAYFYFSPRSDGASQGTTTAAPPAKTKGKGGFDPNRATPVVVEPARVGDINIYLNGLGTITPLRTVTVRSRVDGELQNVAFTEGQLVKAGDLLAQIDPRPFQVQLHTAEAQLAKDEAAIKNARMDLERYKEIGRASCRERVCLQV
jgi:multidrug efflux system membrane fusion protein